MTVEWRDLKILGEQFTYRLYAQRYRPRSCEHLGYLSPLEFHYRCDGCGEFLTATEVADVMRAYHHNSEIDHV
jgi:hypothetical protein